MGLTILKPRLHTPLRRLALCHDCGATFEIGPDCCTACGSRTWSLLARFLGALGDPEHTEEGAA